MTGALNSYEIDSITASSNLQGIPNIYTLQNEHLSNCLHLQLFSTFDNHLKSTGPAGLSTYTN